MSVSARLLATVLLAGCASVAPVDTAVRRPAPAPLIRFGADTFAFPNESRTKNHDKPDLYANYCFVMARAVTQFHRFARFAPDLPRVEPAVYAELVSEVVARAPWRDVPPPSGRI